MYGKTDYKGGASTPVIYYATKGTIMIKKRELYFIFLIQILSIISYGFVYCEKYLELSRSITTTLLALNAVLVGDLIIKKVKNQNKNS
jgi:hypothetical protein